MSLFDYDARPVTPGVVLVGTTASRAAYAIRDFLLATVTHSGGSLPIGRTRWPACWKRRRGRTQPSGPPRLRNASPDRQQAAVSRLTLPTGGPPSSVGRTGTVPRMPQVAVLSLCCDVAAVRKRTASSSCGPTVSWLPVASRATTSIELWPNEPGSGWTSTHHHRRRATHPTVRTDRIRSQREKPASWQSQVPSRPGPILRSV